MPLNNQEGQNSILLDDDVALWFFNQNNTSYQILINNVLREYITLCKNISYYVEVSNKEKAAIYYLLANMNPLQNNISATKERRNFQQYLLSQKKFPYSVFLAMLALLILAAYLSFESVPELSYFFSFSVVIILVVCINDMRTRRIITNEERIQEKFLRMQKEAENNFNIVVKLRSNAKQETLKFIEQDFEYANKKLQVVAGVAGKITPILGIIILTFILGSFNINKYADISLFYKIFQGASGLLAVVTIIISLYNESLTKPQYEVNNKCLYLLKSAQIDT